MKILILGASGTIGSAIFKSASHKYQCWGTYNKNVPLDLNSESIVQWSIEDTATLTHLLEDVSPDVVISSLSGDFEMQLSAHRHIANFLRKTEASMVFVSTANVFDGAVDKPHTELDAPYPVSRYGKFKLECEQLLQLSLDERCLIIRIPKIMTEDVASNLIFGEPVYRNLYASFNTPQNVANAIIKCIQVRKHGVVHVSSYDFMSADRACILMGKSGYIAEDLTLNAYASMMDCQLTDVKLSTNGSFYFALQSVDSILESFVVSCYDIVKAAGAMGDLP